MLTGNKVRTFARYFRFKGSSFRRKNRLDKTIVLMTPPLLGDVLTDEYNSNWRLNIITFVETHIESFLFSYIVYNALNIAIKFNYTNNATLM